MTESLRRTFSIVALLLLAGCGSDDEGITDMDPDPASDVSWSQVEAGGQHACGLASDGRVFCWGSNSVGQRGDGLLDTASVSTPTSVEGDLHFQSLSVGQTHSCALTSEGVAYCWGDNQLGQLGIGTQRNEPFPVAVETDVRFSSIDAGVYHTCAVGLDGAAWCWGGGGVTEDGRDLALGYEPPDTCVGLSSYFSTRCSTSPRSVSGGPSFARIDAGLFTTCGVSTEDVGYCWGWNRGMLGHGGDPDLQGDTVPAGFVTPREVSGGLSFRSISAGALHTCGVAVDDRAYCWGGTITSFNFGQLGTGLREGAPTPVAVDTEQSFARVDAANENSVFAGFTCGLTSGGTALCWGANREGQLGATSPETCAMGGDDEGCTLAPRPVDGGLTFASLSTGLEFTCGAATDGTAYCWGLNDAGQLGDGSRVSSRAPVPVAAPPSL